MTSIVLTYPVHTMDELKLTGNCLLGSRPLLSFDQVCKDNNENFLKIVSFVYCCCVRHLVAILLCVV